MNSYLTPARSYAEGIGNAVADRTINRVKADGTRETWADVSLRVAVGNALLAPNKNDYGYEFHNMHHHLRQASLLMSGRHLQHGDNTQPNRNQEVFTNCLDGETSLYTLERGVTTLREVEGDFVTVRCADGKWREAFARSYGEQELFELTFVSAFGGTKKRVVEHATANHRWILSDGTVTDSIKVGDELAVMPVENVRDPEGTLHGLIFGDGSAHKRRHDHARTGVSQGRTYAAIRVCKQDAVQEEIVNLLSGLGYEARQPAWASGDTCFYIGKKPYIKELPYTTDAEYLAGFIYGWWLADGHKTENANTMTISTSNEQAARWLMEHAGYAGLTVWSHSVKERKEGDGSFANGKPLHIVRMKPNARWKLESIAPVGVEKVYCVEEPVTKSFTLASGLVTGNCSTAAASFVLFYLLLNGSGVGRAYDDHMMVVDWRNLPNVYITVDENYPDRAKGMIPEGVLSKEQVLSDLVNACDIYEVEDSREGWGHAVELLETLAYGGNRHGHVIIDFSKVRPNGSPIRGMQNRPSSGPGATMQAMLNCLTLRDLDYAPWKQAMYVDHYLAESVLVGGARRAARMATKDWRDKTVMDFIRVKQGGVLWSSNNSVTVDEEFWKLVGAGESDLVYESEQTNALAKHAKKVFEAVCWHSYHDGTGEPGLINQDKLTAKMDGIEVYDKPGAYLGSEKFQASVWSEGLLTELMDRFKSSRFKMITNPCGEIPLTKVGGYCVDGSTRILHRAGYDRIVDVVGKNVEVWNGERWSVVTPFQTGDDQELLRVSFSDGSYLDCTPYHRFSVKWSRQGKRFREVEAKDLKIGHILPTFRSSVDLKGESCGHAYTYGAFLGDGWIERRGHIGRSDRYGITLYDGKHHLPVEGSRGVRKKNGGIEVDVRQLDTDRLNSLKEDSLPGFVFQLDYASTMHFIHGWLDTDGTYHKDTGGVSITTCSEDRARGLQLLLRRVGISFASARKVADIGDDTNFGPRKQALWQVYVPSSEAGLLCGERVRSEYPVDLNRLVKQARVVKVELLEGRHKTYCFTEPERGMGVFNNVLTYQCVIADVVPYHAQSIKDAHDAFRTATRALIRTNLMDCLYRKEVNRTNRIGVGITGFHEFAYKFFGYGFRDILDEHKARDFWRTIAAFKRTVVSEAKQYADYLGVTVPHTNTTIKPAGTTSKLFGLSEGAHLPAMAEYLRYVQFRNDDPLIDEYKTAGYPIKELVNYKGTTVVGFPTVPEICTLGMGEKLVTASEATPEEQYQYLRLLEKYWIRGVDESGDALPESGNQVSYTLKYDPNVVSYEEFRRTLQNGQASVRCCSVMPKVDTSAYEYQPETPISKEEFAALVAKIKRGSLQEEIGFEHVDCGSGACPIDFKEGDRSNDWGATEAEAKQANDDWLEDEWLVFGTNNCPACKSAKDLLTSKGFEFDSYNIEGAAAFRFMRSLTKSKSIPVVIHNGKEVGDFNALKEYITTQTN